MKKIISLLLIISMTSSLSANSYSSYSIGGFDYTTGSNGYSSSGYNVGDNYYTNDNLGNSYSSYSIGDFDYTSGSNGYSGMGYGIGDSYYYND